MRASSTCGDVSDGKFVHQNAKLASHIEEERRGESQKAKDLVIPPT